jgi:hypothetical protein
LATVLTPTALWQISGPLVLALDEHLGAPLDRYVNGTQTWLTTPADDDGAGPTLEWRLHPVAAYQPPDGCAHDELWETVVDALSADADGSELRLGREARPVTSLWDGLECFPAYGEEIEPQVLATLAQRALGVAPDLAGLVDHGAIGTRWERSGGKVSLVEMLRDELAGRA